MLNPIEYKNQVRSWANSNRWDLIRISTQKRLDAKGYIKLPLGSIFHHIHKEWFEKAKAQNIISKNELGQWLPIIHIDEVQEAIGTRGLSPVFGGKVKRVFRQSDIDRLNAFIKDYKEWEQKNTQVTIDYQDVLDTFKKSE